MYFKQIDSLRFFAVLLVLITHWLSGVPSIFGMRLGAIGVDFFFVISGFLISLQLYSYKEAVENKLTTFQRAACIFYIRRILRIFPLYYFILILATVLNKGEMRDAAWWNLTFTTNFYLIKIQHWPGIFSQFWSLSVEEHFYWVWPFVVLLVNRRFLVPVFILIILFSFSFRYFNFSDSHDYFIVYVHTFSCLDLFMVGALLSFIYQYQRMFFNKMFSSLLLKICTGLLFVMFFIFSLKHPNMLTFNWVFLRMIFGFVYMFMIGFTVVGFNGFAARVLENKLLMRLGQRSFAIYLVHNLVPGMLLPLKKLGLHYIIEFMVFFIVTILISEVLYRLIEKPARSLNKSFYFKPPITQQ